MLSHWCWSCWTLPLSLTFSVFSTAVCWWPLESIFRRQRREGWVGQVDIARCPPCTFQIEPKQIAEFIRLADEPCVCKRHGFIFRGEYLSVMRHAHQKSHKCILAVVAASSGDRTLYLYLTITSPQNLFLSVIKVVNRIAHSELPVNRSRTSRDFGGKPCAHIRWLVLDPNCNGGDGSDSKSRDWCDGLGFQTVAVLLILKNLLQNLHLSANVQNPAPCAQTCASLVLRCS